MHLRCDDAKPCARCVKKSINCITLESEFEQSTTISPSTSSESTPGQHSGGSVAESSSAVRPIVSKPESSMAQQDQYLHQPYQQQDARPSFQEQAYHAIIPQHPAQTSLPFVSTPSPYNVEPQGSHSLMQPTMPTFGSEMLGQPMNWFPFTGLQDMAYNDRSLFCFGGFEPAYLMTDVDMAFLNTYNYDIPFDVQLPTQEIRTPDPADSLRHTATLAHDAHRKNAIWRWDPTIKDTGVLNRQDLRLPPGSSGRRIAPLGGRTLEEKLNSRTRDKLVELVVQCCESDGRQYVPSWDKWNKTFPSVELLDALIQFCLHFPLAGASLLFHLPTMSIRDARPELVMGLVAMGAVMTPDMALRKLGMALQEVLRQSIISTVC